MFYAQLNENNICIGISQLSGEVTNSKMIIIESADTDKLWRKYEGGVWSIEKYEPVSTAPIDEFTQLKTNQALIQAALDDIILNMGV